MGPTVKSSAYRTARFLALLAAVSLALPWAAGQQPERGPGHLGRPPRPPDGQRPPQTQDAGRSPQTQGAGHEPRFGPRGDWHGRPGIEEVWLRFFRPAPEDQGPLKPGEEDELIAFAKEHAPRIYRALDWLRERSPEKVRQKLAENAPRLRHLRRLYERSPQLGRIVETYAENLFEVQRGAGALQRTAAGSADYEHDVQRLRELVSENVRLESDALEALAGELEANRDQRIENRMRYLLSDEADPIREPEKLRDLVARYRDAADDAQRSALRDLLRDAVTQQVADEIQGLRERAARMKGKAAEEVDRRMERLLEPRPGPGDGPPGRRPPHGRGP